jgi:hypothetical protein
MPSWGNRQYVATVRIVPPDRKERKVGPFRAMSPQEALEAAVREMKKFVSPKLVKVHAALDALTPDDILQPAGEYQVSAFITELR